MHDDEHDDNSAPYSQDLEGERQRLAGIAFRMLGLSFEANLAVAEAFERWLNLTSEERADIGSPQEWLTEAVSKVCLERLSVKPSRRAGYRGNWLPEPVPFPPLEELSSGQNPKDRYTLDESVNMLLMVVLDSLTAGERVAFILHDVFGVGYKEIADVVGRSPVETRRLAKSARLHIQDRRKNEVSAERQRQMVLNLLKACEARDEHAVGCMLHPLVTLLVDSGGKGRAVAGPVEGAEAASRKLIQMLIEAPVMTVSARSVNGGSGLVFRHAERVIGVLSVNVEADKIINIWIVTNPDKLEQWNTS
ncbi:RNA polymerase subunit sigma-24 [Arthrobacter sp. MSA 4-2]|uniref:sigma factor-like helix-turn-helix DNA-binding protein n=1 Tax=Arthrobacter sp. MSA 4-2 TaxID=2794349 RepID=UPI0018E83E19|nr:sigma factor-like helix-turn-helix DNA-binding protein [Arthrobacter sp. MSA 4-2]MBJ2121493.1 RNA polymerase subunit sigma-24 [Arthrobacter sp. MSA 4-2]